VRTVAYGEIVDVAGGITAANKHLVFILFLGTCSKFLVVHNAVLQQTFPVARSHATQQIRQKRYLSQTSKPFDAHCCHVVQL